MVSLHELYHGKLRSWSFKRKLQSYRKAKACDHQSTAVRWLGSSSNPLWFLRSKKSLNATRPCSLSSFSWLIVLTDKLPLLEDLFFFFRSPSLPRGLSGDAVLVIDSSHLLCLFALHSRLFLYFFLFFLCTAWNPSFILSFIVTLCWQYRGDQVWSSASSFSPSRVTFTATPRFFSF